MNALLLQRPDHALDHAVLLGAMRRDELLPKAIAADQRRVRGGSGKLNRGGRWIVRATSA
jgi:hypothetical protein